MQISIRRVASLTSVSPHARKNSSPPPKVPAPRHRTGTWRPLFPNCRNSILIGYAARDLVATRSSEAGVPLEAGVALLRLDRRRRAGEGGIGTDTRVCMTTVVSDATTGGIYEWLSRQ